MTKSHSSTLQIDLLYEAQCAQRKHFFSAIAAEAGTAAS